MNKVYNIIISKLKDIDDDAVAIKQIRNLSSQKTHIVKIINNKNKSDIQKRNAILDLLSHSDANPTSSNNNGCPVCKKKVCNTHAFCAKRINARLGR